MGHATVGFIDNSIEEKRYLHNVCHSSFPLFSAIPISTEVEQNLARIVIAFHFRHPRYALPSTLSPPKRTNVSNIWRKFSKILNAKYAIIQTRPKRIAY